MTHCAEVVVEPSVTEAARHLAAGDAEATLAALAPLVAADPRSLPAHFLLAMTAWQMGRLDWALTLAKECHERWPMDGSVAEALASLHAQTGNLAESLYMGKIGTALGGPGHALAALTPARFPSFDRAFMNIQEQPLLEQAKLSLAGGRLVDAIEKARQHVAVTGGGGEGIEFYASALLRAGKPSVAAEALSAITDQGPIAAPLASLKARSLAAVGDCAQARHWHDLALSLAPDDAAVAAAPIADAAWLEASDARREEAGKDWARRFCPPAKPPQRQRGEGKLTIAYLVTGLVDPLDAAAVAAVARTHDRGAVRVLGYGSGTQSWAENLALSGAFDIWQDVATLDAPTLARFFARDGAHIVVDAAGFATPRNLQALARLPTAVRVSWLGNGPALTQPVYDAALGPASGSFYPVPEPLRRVVRPERAVFNYGADIMLPQLDDETVATWSAILTASPEAKLLLRANDMAKGAIDRLVARFGRTLAARIDMVTAARADEFYAVVDVVLAPHHGVSPRLAAEAVANGVPPVAFGGVSAVAPYAGFLRGLGLGPALVAGDARDYVGIALALAGSREERARVGAMLADAAVACTARHVAAAIERHAAALVAGAAAP